MKVLIPTYGRLAQLTAEHLDAADVPYSLVCSPQDAQVVLRALRRKHKSIIMCTRDAGETIMRKRQWIIENIKGKLVMLDDDLSFRVREDDGSFPRANGPAIRRMFFILEQYLEHYAHGGIIDEFMCNAQPKKTKTHGRYNQVLAYNTKLFPKPVPRFRVECSEEHEFHLQLLAHGLRPFILTGWTKHTRAYYTEGGASTWRNAAREREAHEQIEKLWPDFAKVKSTKHSISGTRIEIRWKEAAMAGGLL